MQHQRLGYDIIPSPDLESNWPQHHKASKTLGPLEKHLDKNVVTWVCRSTPLIYSLSSHTQQLWYCYHGNHCNNLRCSFVNMYDMIPPPDWLTSASYWYWILLRIWHANHRVNISGSFALASAAKQCTTSTSCHLDSYTYKCIQTALVGVASKAGAAIVLILSL